MITPIGTLNTGFELMGECAEDDYAQLMSLNHQSAETALRRLVYYRAAFGYSAALYLNNFEAIEKLIKDYLTPININVDFYNDLQGVDDIKVFVPMDIFARTLLNLVFVMAEISPFGSDVIITLDHESSSLNLKLEASGRLVEMRPEIQAILNNVSASDQYTPHTIQALMTRMLLDETGMVVENIQSSKTNLLMHFTKNLQTQNSDASWLI